MKKEKQENETFEVRDLRNKGFFMAEDAFYDGYVRFLGTNALGVYCSLCRHADKKQKSYPSQTRMAEELNLSSPTINEWIKVLEYFKIIKKQRVGKQCTNRYWLLDKRNWRKDFDVILNELSSGELKQFKFTTKTVLVHDLNRLSSNSKGTQKKGNTKERVAARSSPPSEFSFLKKLNKLKSSPRKDIKIIYLYWSQKQWTFENQKQFEAALKRELRPAKALIGYNSSQINRAMDYCEQNYEEIGWTLETVHKVITNLINKI